MSDRSNSSHDFIQQASSRAHNNDTYEDSCLHVEHERYFASCRGKVLTLTKTEFRLLSRLVKSINEIVSFEELWKYAWDSGKELNIKSVNVFASKLRRQLAPLGLRIDTVVSVGYMLSHGSCCKAQVKTIHDNTRNNTKEI